MIIEYGFPNLISVLKDNAPGTKFRLCWTGRDKPGKKGFKGAWVGCRDQAVEMNYAQYST